MHAAIRPAPVCIFRFAIEEMETWYLGDFAAVLSAFPRAKVKHLRDWAPDSICGSWEMFQTLVSANNVNKVEWSEKMGIVLRADEPLDKMNRSPSFRKFCRRVRELVGDPGPVNKRKRR